MACMRIGPPSSRGLPPQGTWRHHSSHRLAGKRRSVRPARGSSVTYRFRFLVAVSMPRTRVGAVADDRVLVLPTRFPSMPGMRWAPYDERQPRRRRPSVGSTPPRQRPGRGLACSYGSRDGYHRTRCNCSLCRCEARAWTTLEYVESWAASQRAPSARAEWCSRPGGCNIWIHCLWDRVASA